jgi:hypothetical protein
MGQVIFDYNKRLILLSVVQLSGGHFILKKLFEQILFCDSLAIYNHKKFQGRISVEIAS